MSAWREAAEPSSSRVALGADQGFDEEIYGSIKPSSTSIAADDLKDDETHPHQTRYEMIQQQHQQKKQVVSIGDDERLAGRDSSDDVFDAYRKSRVSDRDNEYRVRRFNRELSPTRADPFATAPKTNQTNTNSDQQQTADEGRTYREVLMEKRLQQEEAAILRNIEKKRRELADQKRNAAVDSLKAEDSSVIDAAASNKKRRRWDLPDDELDESSKAAEIALIKQQGPQTAVADGEDDDTDELDWDTTSLLKPQPSEEAEDEEETTNGTNTTIQPTSVWDPTLAANQSKKLSRWDATPALNETTSSSAWDATPKISSSSLSSFEATPLMSAATPSRKKSRWDETPVMTSNAFSMPTPLYSGPGSQTPLQKLSSLTPSQLQAYRLQAELDERNKPLTDAELDALLPGPADGYEILAPPETYQPIRTPSRKLMMTPTPMNNQEGFFMPTEALSDSLASMIPALPAESGLPAFNKPDDKKFFGSLLEDVDEDQLSAEKLKERRIMKLLLKIKNGTPPQRKSALRSISDKAREFGAGPLFDQILPLLMSPTLEDQERHVLVKVIDRILYKLDELVRPYVHKILVVIEPLLIDEDYFARVEGREIISNLAKAAGLATMIATMRGDIDNPDEYVRNTTARALAVVASALGIHSLLPFLQAVCQSKRSWEARHTGIKIVQQIAILMGVAILPHLTSLVTIIQHGLTDEQIKVKCITALCLAALAEAAAPYGIESFDSVLRPLWIGVKNQRGKTLAAFLKAIGYIIPLMDSNYASYYTNEIKLILIREFATPDEEMKKIVLKVVKQCVSTEGVELEFVKKEILPEFFRQFWVRRMALDKRNYRELVETTVELSIKVGAAEIVGRIVQDLKDESEIYRKMVMETIERVIAGQGVADIDPKLEESLIDGLLYAFQEQQSEDMTVATQLMNSFGVIINALNQRCKLYLPQICGIIKWRLNNKLARVRQQAADLLARIAPVMHTCGEDGLLGHLGEVLFEYLGEEYPDVLAAIIGALKSVVVTLGVANGQPSVTALLPRLTPILKNRHERVQENTIDLVGRIADQGSEFVHHKEWMRICFELLELLKAPKRSIRRASVNTFGYIAKAIGPHDVLSTLLNNLRVQERQNRVCTCVAIAIVAETCSPFTVLPALINEYTVPELNVQNGVLKALSFLFEYIGEMGKDYVYAVIPILQDALMDRDAVHRQTACTVVKHLALGCIGMNREDAFIHLLNYVWPNIFETSPHVITATLEAIEGIRCSVGSARLLCYLLQGLFHPARKVRNVYWKIYNSMYIACVDEMVATYPELPNDQNNDYRRYELEVFL